MTFRQIIISTILILISQTSFGQTYNLDRKYKILLPQRADWKISTNYCDTINNICQYIQIQKDFKTKERKFADITIKYENPNNEIIADQNKNECDLGTITKTDTVNISGYKVRRRFGINCDWLIEDRGEKKIAGHSVDLIINLDKSAYIRIMSSYFSSDKSELNLIEADLLSLISDIKINGH